ncbi:MAG: tetratricopeptide repeat protein [Bacillota bacterium]
MKELNQYILKIADVEEIFQEAEFRYKNSEIDFALKLYSRVWRLGDLRGCYGLALCFLYRNVGDSNRNNKLAFHFAQICADQGSQEGKCLLAHCYGEGIGTEVNHEKQIKLLEELASQNFPIAYRLLGLAYISGYGRDINNEKAIEHYKKGAELNDTRSQSRLGSIYRFGTITEKDVAKSIYWYTRAADNGDERAQFFLGLHYSSEYSEEKDIEKAKLYFAMAAKQGSKAAAERYEQLESVPIGSFWDIMDDES